VGEATSAGDPDASGEGSSPSPDAGVPEPVGLTTRPDTDDSCGVKTGCEHAASSKAQGNAERINNEQERAWAIRRIDLPQNQQALTIGCYSCGITQMMTHPKITVPVFQEITPSDRKRSFR
jgi:hypothetical protein